MCHVTNARPSIDSLHRAVWPRNTPEYQCLWFQFYRASIFFCMETFAELSLPSCPPSVADWSVVSITGASETTKHAPLSFNRGNDNNDTTISRKIIGWGGAVVGAVEMTMTMVGRHHQQQRIAMGQRRTTGPIVGDLGIAARQGWSMHRRSEDDNPQGYNRCLTEAVNTLDCGIGRGITGVRTSKQMSAPASARQHWQLHIMPCPRDGR